MTAIMALRDTWYEECNALLTQQGEGREVAWDGSHCACQACLCSLLGVSTG